MYNIIKADGIIKKKRKMPTIYYVCIYDLPSGLPVSRQSSSIVIIKLCNCNPSVRTHKQSTISNETAHNNVSNMMLYS